MLFKLKNLVLLFSLGLCGWVGWNTYLYFFDSTLPEVKLSGLEADSYYSGDVQCNIVSNKRGEISVWLDNQPLINHFKVSAGNQEQPFIIPTKTIINGKHALKVEFVDKTMSKNKVIIDRNFNVDNVPLQAAFVKAESDYKVFQGRTLRLQFQVNKEIKQAQVRTSSNTIPCFAEAKGSLIYESYIPIACEENPNEYLLTVEITDRVGNTLNLDNKFQVVPYPFKKATVKLSNETLAEEKKLEEEGAAETHFNEIVAELTKKSPCEKLWKGAFCTPIDIVRVTCEFGTVRTSQHKGRYAHKALDIINAPKSCVWSPQDGIVVCKDRFVGCGNTVIVDHGWGILSMFFHLDNFANIKVGDKIALGNPVGTIGKTGYATGYHLHWEMRVNNIPVDPMQWTKLTF